MIERPLTDASDFTEVHLVVRVEGETEVIVGLNWARMKGKTQTILARAIKPDEQGKGYSNQMDRDQQTYVFDILSATRVRFQVFSDVPQLTDKIAEGRRFARRGESIPGRDSESGKTLIPAELTRAGYETLRKDHTEWVTFHWLGPGLRGVEVPHRN